MKTAKKITMIFLAMGLALALTGCPPGPAVIENTNVTFNSVTANGSPANTTTHMTLAFSQAVAGLSLANISVSGVPGVTLGGMSGSGAVRTISISGFTGGGSLSVSVSSPAGYVISGGPLSVNIFHFTSPPANDNDNNNNDNDTSGGDNVVTDTAVTFLSVTADGSPTTTTTQLTLVFNRTISRLSAANILISGVPGVTLSGQLSGTGPVFTFPVSGVTVGGSLSVAVSSPPGYAISGGPLSVNIFHFVAPEDTTPEPPPGGPGNENDGNNEDGNQGIRTARVTFVNMSSYPVNVRLNHFQGVAVVENLPGGATRAVDVRVSDHALGTVFSVEYLWRVAVDFEPESGYAFASGFDPDVQLSHVIQENRPVTIQIPQPQNVEFRTSFITILNAHNAPIDLRHFGTLLRQTGNGLFPIPPGRTGIYMLDPIPLGQTRQFEGFNIGGNVPVPGFTAENGYIYRFIFSGGVAELIEARRIVVR